MTLWTGRDSHGVSVQLSEHAARSLLADLRAHFAEATDAPYLVN